MDLRLSLEGLRKQLARDKRCQDFKIFASKTLDSLVSTMPASEDALLKINGIGPIKKEDF
jgi:superfamily II DNA helicase RecQ